MDKTIAVVLLVCAASCSASSSIRVTGEQLEVRTSCIAAKWRASDLVSLKNVITGETYTARDNSPTDALSTVRVLNRSGDMHPVSGWQVEGNTASLQVRGDKAGFTLRISVDPVSEDVVIQQLGESPSGGIHGVRWALRGIDLGRTSVVVPSSGGRIVTQATTCGSGELDYPTMWEAQMVILQGRRGSVLVWSTDSTAQFKRLIYRRARDLFDLGFETEPQAPFTDIKQVEAVEWRLNAFKGDWRAAAGKYREFLYKTYPPSKLGSAQEWARNIYAVVTVHGRTFGADVLEALTAKLEPAKTLLYIPDWRMDGYDVNYPDYTPMESLQPFVDNAHKLGFRVMLHADLPGATPGNPDYEKVKDTQVRERFSGDLMGWYWDKLESKQRFAFINPASSKFRTILVAELREAIAKTGADALHLDVSGPMWNDANGLIEGMNYCRGSMQLHRDLAAALPDVVLGGETLNELTYGFEKFAQRWAHVPFPFDPHPICAFLFGEQCVSYGYLGLPNPDSALSRFTQYVRVYEPQDVLPTLVLSSAADLAANRPYLNLVADMAKAWQKHEFVADFESKWRSDEKFRFRGNNGAVARIVGAEKGSKLLVNGEILYQWLTGVDRVESKWRIPRWPARDGDLSFGLDPARTYWLLPGDSSPPTVCYLPEGVTLDQYRAAPNLFGVTLKRSAANVVYDFLARIQDAEVGVIISGKRRPLDYGAMFQPGSESSGGVQRNVLFMHPPWKPTGVPGDDLWGDVFGDYRVKLPEADGNRLMMRFGIGISDETRRTDGATFAVFCNGESLFSEHVPKGRWHDRQVDLTRFAGTEVTIRLLVGPGPKHDTVCDHALWSEMRIERSASCDAANVVLRPGKPPAALVRSDRPSAEKAPRLRKGELTVEDLPLPGSAFALFAEPTSAKLPLNLIEAKSAVGFLDNGIYRSGAIWGSGTREEATCDGVKRQAINAHPPSSGRTVLTWTLKLPESPASLHAYAGVRDGAATDGVGFLIAVNGNVLWSDAIRKPGWRKARVNLSRWAGQIVVLDLITDSQGEAYCDWACWGEPTIH